MISAIRLAIKMGQSSAWLLPVLAVMMALIQTAAGQQVAEIAPVDKTSSPLPADHTESRIHVDGGFWQGFVASLSIVLVSELGDKTFFIAAIMAMKHPRLVVFSGAIAALAFMTVLSAAFGWVATVVPRVYTYYLSAALFAIFGLKMLRDGWKMDPNEGLEELDEVQSDLRRRDDQTPEQSGATEEPGSSGTADASPPLETEAGPSPSPEQELAADRRMRVRRPRSVEKEERTDFLEAGEVRVPPRRTLRVLIQAATLTFLAEWGDRSQIATVILGARENVSGVVVGGVLGHSLCTGLAVIGGRMVAQRISVRTVTIIGGVVFLLFAVSALFIDPGD